MTSIIKFAPGLRPILKHNPGTHDQKTHGSWASGAEIENWNPNDPVPSSPRNAGGMTQTIWDNWEHGVDGNQYVELYRQYAAEQLGLKVPESPMAPGGYLNYLTERGFGGSSTETSKGHAKAMLNAIANGSPTQPALYRGLYANPEDASSQALVKQFSELKPGDTIDMPLVSTTRSLGVATWYAADRNSSATDKVVMKIQPGAKGVSVAARNSRYPADHEVVTSGKFEVVGVNKVTTPYWSRGTFEPRKIEYTDGRVGYEVATYSPKRYSPDEAKSIWNTIESKGIQALATNTLKFTDDRYAFPGRKLYSSWEKQNPTTFTVVEVKMVEPHVVQKAIDHGMTFDALFNNIPFIRDEEVMKHGEHNQKTHGSWANGSEVVTDINEWNKAELAKYPSKSDHEIEMMDKLLSQRVAGFDGREFHKAVNDYQTMLGYTANEALRDPNIGEGQVQYMIDGLDAAIKAAPPLSSETTVYRGIKGNGLDFFETLNSGDVFQDKGFVSTTLDTDVATAFSVQGNMYQGIVMRMKLPAGTKGLYPTTVTGLNSLSSREAEFVLPRDSKFKVLNNQGKVWDVELVND